MIGKSPMFDLKTGHYDKPKPIKFLYISLGWFFVGLGILGIVLPILPATVFFILAAACFLRSSKKNYDWLTTNRWIGKYIKDYVEKKGMTPRSKLTTILFLWLSLFISIVFFVHALWLKILLIVIGIGVTIHVTGLKRAPDSDEEKTTENAYRENES